MLEMFRLVQRWLLNQLNKLINLSNRNNARTSGKKTQVAIAGKECTSTTRIVKKINKIERQIIDEKLTLVDDDGKPLPKVFSTANVDSDSEVKDVVDDHAVFMASRGLKRGADSGYDTNSLSGQWRTTKRDDDYDPYDDDLYESHDMSGNLHAIFDDFDITVRGRKKK
uniref:Uncharacterized protein n=1 Tax=Tanacetum cinerariifolium TaxID=118510 RepID=A0A699J7U2_TANCI|nr:hypothetical protein [Tanacetum cinerariifolium]